LRVVPVVGRMAVRTGLLAHSGEFMEHNGPSVNPPRWVVVWW
jgi:hypothetical protein